MKKKIVGLLGFGATAGAAFAEGSTLPASFSTSLNSFKTSALEAVDAVVPVISEVLVALFVITAIWFIYHAVRKALR